MGSFECITFEHIRKPKKLLIVRPSQTRLIKLVFVLTCSHFSLSSPQVSTVAHKCHSKNILTAKHNQLMAKHNQLTAKHNQLMAKHNQLTAKQNQIMAEHNQLTAEHNQLTEEHQLTIEHNQFTGGEHNRCTAEQTKFSTVEVKY